MVLAQLVQQVGDRPRRAAAPAAAAAVAVALVRHLRGQIAVVQHLQREALPRQGRHRLFVHPAPRSCTPRGSSRGSQLGALLPPPAPPSIRLATRSRPMRGVASCRQRLQRVGIAADPLVGIEHQAPVTARSAPARHCAPRRSRRARARTPPARRSAAPARRVVHRAGVQHPHFVDPGRGAAQAALDAARLVARDHHQGQGRHARRLRCRAGGPVHRYCGTAAAVCSTDCAATAC